MVTEEGAVLIGFSVRDAIVTLMLSNSFKDKLKRFWVLWTYSIFSVEGEEVASFDAKQDEDKAMLSMSKSVILL